MKIIGLTGGIAVGKSEVAKIMRLHNIPVFDADAAVHEIYRNGIGAKLLEPILPAAIDAGVVDRKKLSEIIAADPSMLREIEKIIHPLIHHAEADFLSRARSENESIAVIDSPLIFETNRHKEMDAIILVDASAEAQTKRAMMRPGMTQQKLTLIKNKQLPSHEKRKSSTFIIENNSNLDELKARTEAIIAQIREL